MSNCTKLTSRKAVQTIRVQIVENGYLVDYWVKDPLNYAGNAQGQIYFATFDEAISYCSKLEADIVAERLALNPPIEVTIADENKAASESESNDIPF